MKNIFERIAKWFQPESSKPSQKNWQNDNKPEHLMAEEFIGKPVEPQNPKTVVTPM